VTVSIGIAVGSGRVESLVADVLVLPFFESDRPLRGPVARADWRLCGLLSALLRAGRVRGVPGEAVLLPSGGHLRTPLILAVGLGARAGFGAARLRAATSQAFQRVAGLGAQTVVFALPTELGPEVPMERAAESWLEGAVQAASGLDGALSCQVLVPERGAAAAGRGLTEAVARHQSGDLALHWAQPRSASAGPVRPVSSAGLRRGISPSRVPRPAPS
jgi:hypothetical protein